MSGDESMSQEKKNEDCTYLMKDQTCVLGPNHGPCKDCKLFTRIKLIDYNYADVLHEEMKTLERTTIKKMALIGRMIRSGLKKWADDADALEQQLNLLSERVKKLEEGKK